MRYDTEQGSTKRFLQVFGETSKRSSDIIVATSSAYFIDEKSNPEKPRKVR